MKLILVASMAAVLSMGISGTAKAHGYPVGGGSLIWADDDIVIGLNYGGPYLRPYYVPPRYVYRPRYDHRRVFRNSRHHGYKRGYRKSHSRGHRGGHHKGHYHDRGRGRHDHRRH